MEPAPGGFRIEVLLAHREWVARTARALVRGDAEAGDLEQDAWLGILERPPAAAPRSPRAWLRSVLRFRSADRARASGARRRHEAAAARPEGGIPGAEEVVSRAEVAERVARAVLALEEPFRTTVLLRYFEGLEPGEIARRMGIPPETARTRLHRALGRLRERLDAGSGGERRAWCLALLPLLREPCPSTAASGSVAGTGAAVGGLVMTQKAVGLAAAVLVAGGGLGWWAAARGETAAPAALAAEVAGLRAVAEEQSKRIARLEKDAALAREGHAARIARLEDSVARSTVGPSARLDRLETAVASLEAGRAAGGGPPVDAAARKRKVLEELQGISDPLMQIAIREALRELVRIGDPVVPDIVALLDSGLEKRYHEKGSGMAMAAGQITYCSLRMVLIDALRQIGTPASKDGLLKAVARSRLLTDYRDLLMPYQASSDPAIVGGISALVPDMLRKLGEAGAEGEDLDAVQLARYLVHWIRRHELTEALGVVEEMVLKAQPGPDGWSAQDAGLFGLLVEFSPERAVQAVLKLQERNANQPSERQPVQAFAHGIASAVPLARLAQYCELLFARGNPEPELRRNLYSAMPPGLYGGIRDPGKRAEDGRVLAAFLEARLGAETDAGTKAQIESVLSRLRRAIEQARR